MPHNYCIWCRVKEADDREAETVVRALQARLGCRTGVPGRLLKKRAAGAYTWMELYEGVCDVTTLERQLQALTEQFDVDMFLADSRHVERLIEDGAEAARPSGAKGN